MHNDIKSFTQQYRETIEPHWAPDLLYEKFTANPDDAPSAGFCGPSSVLLWQELQKTFPTETFTLAVGRVYKNKTEWIRGKHVWMVWHHALKGATIVDITADQSKDIDAKVNVEDVDTLAQSGIHYTPYQLTRAMNEVDESPKKRAELLKSRLK